MSWFAGEVKFKITAVDNASNAIEKVDQAVEQTKNRFQELTDIMKTAAGVMIGELAKDAANKTVEAFGQAGEKTADLEWTLKGIVAASGEVGDAAEQLYSQLNKVAHAQTDLGVTSNQAAEALESLVKAGLSGQEAADALRSSLEMAKIEGISAAEASDMLVGIMNQFGYSAKDATKVVDALTNASVQGVDTASDFALGLSYVGAQASSMGLNLQETLAALVALNNQGIAAEKAGRYLASMLTDLVDKNDKLGFSIYDANGKLLSLHEIIGRLSEKLKSFGSDEERNTYLTSIFGNQSIRAALSLLNLAQGGISASAVLAELTGKMGAVGTATNLTNTLMDTAKGRMMKLQAEISNANESLGAMTLQMELTWKQFALGLGPIGAVADALGPSVLQGAISGVMIMIPQLITSIGGASAAFSSFASFLTGPVGLAIMGAVAAGALLYEAWINDWGGIRTYVCDTVLPALTSAWNTFVSGLKWAWDNIFVPFGEFIVNVWIAEFNALKPVLTALHDFFDWLGNGLPDFDHDGQVDWDELPFMTPDAEIDAAMYASDRICVTNLGGLGAGWFNVWLWNLFTWYFGTSYMKAYGSEADYQGTGNGFGNTWDSRDYIYDDGYVRVDVG